MKTFQLLYVILVLYMFDISYKHPAFCVKRQLFRWCQQKKKLYCLWSEIWFIHQCIIVSLINIKSLNVSISILFYRSRSHQRAILVFFSLEMLYVTNDQIYIISLNLSPLLSQQTQLLTTMENMYKLQDEGWRWVRDACSLPIKINYYVLFMQQ